MEPNGWLKIHLEKMQAELTEVRQDVKLLLEAKAKNQAMIYIISGLITISINLLAIWLRV